MLLYYGIAIPTAFDNINWSKAFVEWLSKLDWLYAPASETLKSRLDEYAFLHTEYLHVCNELRSYARGNYNKDYYLLRSIPGIGPFVAIGTLAEVGDLRRFKSINRLSSYIGLVPALHSSGSKTFTKGITVRSKHLLRSYLIEGAWNCVRKDPELMQYCRKRKGTDHKKLVIKVASKTLSRMYSVIKRGELFKLKEPLLA